MAPRRGAYFAGREELQACAGPLRRRSGRPWRTRTCPRRTRFWPQCEALGIWVLTCQDTAYPQRLGQLDSAPCVLYGRGRLPQMDQEAAGGPGGARQASPYGIMAAGRLGLDLARQKALVVSGMAQGVDAAALRGALRGGGRVACRCWAAALT
ncbi:MAG: DNA-processing protein DprA [Evtepia gabavorous]